MYVHTACWIRLMGTQIYLVHLLLDNRRKVGARFVVAEEGYPWESSHSGHSLDGFWKNHLFSAHQQVQQYPIHHGRIQMQKSWHWCFQCTRHFDQLLHWSFQLSPKHSKSKLGQTSRIRRCWSLKTRFTVSLTSWTGLSWSFGFTNSVTPNFLAVEKNKWTSESSYYHQESTLKLLQSISFVILAIRQSKASINNLREMRGSHNEQHYYSFSHLHRIYWNSNRHQWFLKHQQSEPLQQPE